MTVKQKQEKKLKVLAFQRHWRGLWTVGSGKGSSCPNTLRRRNLRTTHCVCLGGRGHTVGWHPIFTYFVLLFASFKWILICREISISGTKCHLIVRITCLYFVHGFYFLWCWWFGCSWIFLADCPAMSFVLVCWHSRKWQPPIRGGLLHLLVLWLEKLNKIDFFLQNWNTLCMRRTLKKVKLVKKRRQSNKTCLSASPNINQLPSTSKVHK